MWPNLKLPDLILNQLPKIGYFFIESNCFINQRSLRSYRGTFGDRPETDREPTGNRPGTDRGPTGERSKSRRRAVGEPSWAPRLNSKLSDIISYQLPKLGYFFIESN